MNFTADFDASPKLERLMGRLRRVMRPDPTLLMKTWTDIIIRDNARGVMKGQDRYGSAMPPVTYRPINKAKPAKLTRAQKNTDNPRQRRGEFGGFGPSAAGLNNNLTTAEYQQLGGPPLAPRGYFSRVITNLKPGVPFADFTGTQWTAWAWWDQVVDTKGRLFLHHHFDGIRFKAYHGTMFKRRDLRGVRPEGMEEARRAMIAWMADQIRTYGRAG